MKATAGLTRFTAALVVAATMLAGGAIASPSTATAAPMSPGAAAAPSAYDTASEQAFISRINGLRRSKGLSILVVTSELTGIARRWTDHMVSQGGISHNPSYSSQVHSNWSKLGENVGVGYDVESLWQAFLNSPGHYNNLVDPAWTHLGVGAVRASDGRLFTTHDFERIEGSAPPPTSPPPTTAPPSNAAPPTNPGSGSGSGHLTSPAVRSTPIVPIAPIVPVAPATPPALPSRVAAVLVALHPLSG
jgi:uncharacterized protein YkwD